MKELTELPDIDHLIELAAADPIRAALECRQAYGTLNLAYRERLYVLLGAIYGVEYAIERDPNRWKAFIKHDFWKSSGKRQPRREKDRDKRLRFAFVFVLSATTDALYDRAYNYSRALQGSYNKGVKPERIPDLIKNAGGIEALYDQAVQKARKKKKRVSTRDYWRDLVDPDDDAGSKADQSNAGRQVPKRLLGEGQRKALNTDVIKDALDNALWHMRQPRTQLQSQIVGAVARLEAGLLDWAKRRQL